MSFQLEISACAMLLSVGSYWLIISICKEVRNILCIFEDEAAKTIETQSNKLKLLGEFIDAHGTVKQLSR